MSVTWRARWQGDNGGPFHEATVTLSDDGRASMRGHRTIGERHPCAEAKPKPRKRCRSCRTNRVHRWLGIRWLGVPWPVRHARRWFFLDRRSDWNGCGCMAFPKWLTGRMFKTIGDYRAFIARQESE